MGRYDNSLVSGYIKKSLICSYAYFITQIHIARLGVYYSDQAYKDLPQFQYMSHTHSHTLNLSHTGSPELIAPSAPQKTKLEHFPSEVALEHFEMNTNIAYGTTAEIATTENIAYTTVKDAIPATQSVAYEQVPPGTDDCYDYIIHD